MGPNDHDIGILPASTRRRPRPPPSVAHPAPTGHIPDPATDLVVILTRHDLHAPQLIAALDAGKHVFCEKPPCLNEAELAEIVRGLDRAGGERILALGYNRRFAPR